MLRKLFQNRPELKSPRELGLMREAGKVVTTALRLAKELTQPGVKTAEIDHAIQVAPRARLQVGNQPAAAGQHSQPLIRARQQRRSRGCGSRLINSFEQGHNGKILTR